MQALTLAILGLLCSSAAAVSSLMPDPQLTPGDAQTRDPNIICTPGYARAARDAPQKLKNQVYTLYGITTQASHEFEIDHLISLELGGFNSVRNLWPQSYITEPLSARVKDKLEGKLHKLACDGTITFEEAQAAIAVNWVSAYRKYVGALPGGMETLPSSTPPSSPTSSPPSSPLGSRATVQPNENGSCPPSAPLKGSGTKKYHLPGGRYYDNTKAKLCFATEANAQRTGYLKAKGQ